MADWYQKTGEEALKHFDVTTDGLSSEQAAEQLKKDGKNVLAEGKKKTVLQVFLGQFADLLVLILIAAAIVSMFSGNIESTIVIFAVIIMNAILGTAQHVKAEKSLDSLKSLS
ncbi:MAG: ATPase, partial [Ruminococcus sp.]|nr:ATPase [Ruminococcus sp.]